MCAISWKFSGLVIEGQPQQPRGVTDPIIQFSGLVIEGQPQRPRCSTARLASLAVW